VILCVDGGGSKSRMLLVDDNLRLAGEGQSLGTNTNHTPLEEARANLKDCLRQTIPNGVKRIDRAYVTLMGDKRDLSSLLEEYECEVLPLDEPQAGLWAGALRETGFVALSGTGSDAFYVGANKRTASLGGWGLLMGDEGSGAWIGQQALRAVIRDLAGIGPRTLLTDRAHDALETRGDIWEIIRQLYAAPSYVRYMAAFVPEAACAASEGDILALDIFVQAGEHLADLLLLLVQSVNPPPMDRFCVLSGGAWKAHPAMFESFAARMFESEPGMTLSRPLFEPMMAGIVLETNRRFPDWTKARREDFLRECFAGYRIS